MNLNGTLIYGILEWEKMFHLINFDKKWCLHFTSFITNHHKVRWSYQLFTLIKTLINLVLLYLVLEDGFPLAYYQCFKKLFCAIDLFSIGFIIIIINLHSSWKFSLMSRWIFPCLIHIDFSNVFLPDFYCWPSNMFQP